MLNRWVRYLPIIDLLEDPDGGLALEVGSGSLGMGEFVDRPFVGCDVLFAETEFSTSILPVCGTGTELPFRDRSFSLVLCLDTMEHVPRRFRPAVLEELLRVTEKTLIVGAPMGHMAASADRKLHEFYSSKKREEPLWLKEHIDLIDEFPELEELTEVLQKQNIPFETRSGESAVFHSVVIRLEHTRYVGRMIRMLSTLPWRILISPLVRLVNMSSSYRTYIVIRK